MKYLFVCTGNTCRSPMAEVLARKYYPNNEYASAGISAVDGLNASEGAIHAMRKYGIDLTSHSSASLSPDMIFEYDYIIPMTNSHKKTLIMYGIPLEKIMSFKNDIQDPFMYDDEVYLECANQIKENLAELFGETDVD